MPRGGGGRFVIALLANPWVRRALGALAIVAALYALWGWVQGQRALRLAAQAESDRVTGERDRIKAQRDLTLAAYEHQAKSVRELTAKLARSRCDGTWRKTTMPDGRIIEECVGVTEVTISSTTMRESDERPILPPIIPPIVPPTPPAVASRDYPFGLIAHGVTDFGIIGWQAGPTWEVARGWSIGVTGGQLNGRWAAGATLAIRFGRR
jgi:hypothetical protein